MGEQTDKQTCRHADHNTSHRCCGQNSQLMGERNWRRTHLILYLWCQWHYPADENAVSWLAVEESIRCL